MANERQNPYTASPAPVSRGMTHRVPQEQPVDWENRATLKGAARADHLIVNERAERTDTASMWS